MQTDFPDLKIPSVVERFLRYVQIDTQSDPNSETVPSTEKQKHLADVLEKELKAIGVEDAEMDQYGYVLATIPGTLKTQSLGEQTVLALFAHMDTAPDESGANVCPIVHPPYDGGIIQLPGNSAVKLDPGQQPALLKHLGDHLITSDGTTLLGSDDKAGIAILIQFAEDILEDPSPRPTVRLCFTIDEEIGRGVDHLDLEKLGASVAYTLDGSGIDTISFETFNAAAARIKVTGRSVHPGYAKGVLVNAVRILAEIVSSLPMDEAPETTEDREGYYHAHTTSSGNVTEASAQIILRDFSESGLLSRKLFIESLVEKKKQEYPEANIALEINDQYKNMRSYIEELDARTIELAFDAASDLGIDLKEEIVRGGTDGARLSEKGLPTPNVFNGGYDYHSRFEWNTVENLEHSLAFIKTLVHCWGRRLNNTSG